MKKISSRLYGIIGLLIIGVLITVAILGPTQPAGIDSLNSVALHAKAGIDGTVCIDTTGEFEGRKTKASAGIKETVQCKHNTLYNTGAEVIEDYLADGSGGGDAFDWIELCDSLNFTCNTPIAIEETAVFDSLNYTNWTGCGMDEVAGTVGDVGNGNWTIYNTFTSTCDDVTTNVTRLRNADHDVLAGVYFTGVIMQTNDQTTVNWTLTAE